MNKTAIALWLFIITATQTIAPALPLLMQNQYSKTIRYRTNQGENNLSYGAQTSLGDINSITSLAIKSAGIYSSLNKYLQILKLEQENNQNLQKHPLIVILPTNPHKPLAWNIAWDWIGPGEQQSDVWTTN